MGKCNRVVKKLLHFDGLVSWEDVKSIRAVVSVKWKSWLLTHKEHKELVSWEDGKSIQLLCEHKMEIKERCSHSVAWLRG